MAKCSVLDISWRVPMDGISVVTPADKPPHITEYYDLDLVRYRAISQLTSLFGYCYTRPCQACWTYYRL